MADPSLSNFLVNRPRPDKPTIKCWGCGKEEDSSTEKVFMCCPRCIKANVLAANFCSQECFRASWPRHKQWHADHEKQEKVTGNVNFFPTNEKALRDLSGRSTYDAFIVESGALLNTRDFVGAQKILRRAQKLDSRRPEAYFDQALCYERSGQEEDAIDLYTQAADRWAFVALTGFLGDGKIEEARHPTWAMEQWVLTVDNVMQILVRQKYSPSQKQSPPSWYVHDATLKRVTKLALDKTQADPDSLPGKRRDMLLMHAYTLSGIVSRGLFHTEASIPEDRTSDELMEAATCFQCAVDLGECDKNQSDLYTSHAQVMMAAARAWREQESRTGDTERAPRAGTLVFIRGLTSPVGLKMNNKLGLVLGKGPPESSDRLIVQVDGVSGRPLLKPSNLFKMPLKDDCVALLACLEEKKKWAFLRPVLDRILDGLLST